MGMFDFNPADVRVATSEGYTNAPMLGAFAGYGGMLQGIGKLAGFQDEEDLLKDIYDTSDFTTKEGREEAIARIRQVNPEKAAELTKQILSQEQAEAAIVNTQIQTDNAKLERAKVIYGPALVRKFETDVSNTGQRAAIHAFLTSERIDFNPKKVITMIDAIKAIEDEVGDKGSSTYITGLEAYVGDKQDLFVNQGVYAKAGLTLDTSEDTTVAESTERGDLIDPPPADTTAYVANEVNENDSNFTKAYKTNKATNEIKQKLQDVKQSLFNLGIEAFMPQDRLAIENAEDAVSAWIAGPAFGTGEITGTDSSALNWFLSQPPEELAKFVANPVAYYKENRSRIESSVTYSGTNNEDLFASIPYNLDS